MSARVRVDFRGVRRPEERSDARSSVARVALAAVRAARAAAYGDAPSWSRRIPRGAVYVTVGHEDEPYEAWRLSPSGLVLRSVDQPLKGFMTSQSGGPIVNDSCGYWLTREQWERRAEWLPARAAAEAPAEEATVERSRSTRRRARVSRERGR